MSEPKYTLLGRQISADALATLAKIPTATMHYRLQRGMSPEQAIVQPKRVIGADMTGEVFGRLTVIERAGETAAGKPMWKCVCSCPAETIKIVVGADLRSGKVEGCGCVRRERSAAKATARAEDLTGQKFADGAVEVVGVSDNTVTTRRGPNGLHKHRLWRCKCECGETFDAKASQLRIGQVTSCGCGVTHYRRTKEAAELAARRFDVAGMPMTLDEIERVFKIGKATLVYRIEKKGMSVEEAISTPLRATYRGQKKCSACGALGHNRLGCTAGAGAAP